MSTVVRVKFIKTKVILGIIPKASQSKFHQILIAKSKVIHIQISVPKWEKTKKWENIFWVSNRDRDYNSGQEITIRGRDYKSVQNNQ